MSVLAGVDIGGTKCAVVLAQAVQDGPPHVIAKATWPTPTGPDAVLGQLVEGLWDLSRQTLGVPAPSSVTAIGISCGGPLNIARGTASPPNLPGWTDVDVVTPFRNRFQVPVTLENDANAGALAEWRWGAGQGCSHLVFLTFGTGMGAGLIVNGALYRGANDLAGEVGHWRLADQGPMGFGKAGSFEGFCSGGGIARLATLRAVEATGAAAPIGQKPVSAETLAQAAQRGDALALGLWREVGDRLGQALALLVDLLNPQLIILGSIYGRQRPLLEDALMARLRRECIPDALAACRIVPAALGESIGDMASLAVAAVRTNGTS